MQTLKEFAEAMTMQQRMKAKATFRKNKSKIAMGRKRAERRTASPEKLKARANKTARKEVEKKLLQGKSKSDMSFAARQALEKRVDKKKAVIARMAKKLVPKMRKKEMERKRARNKSTNEEIDRHGIPKDVTKAELQAIRSSDASKEKKDLAHWLLNMHHSNSKD